MRPPRPKKTDAIALLLKASFTGRRRSPWRLVVLAAILLGFFGLAALWMWPAPIPSQVIMTAPDAVAQPDESVQICARLEALKPEQRGLSLSGCELYFQAANSPDVLGKVVTGRNGVASVQARFPESANPLPVIVRYAGIKNRQRGAQADSRVFVWPAQSSLLVVDVDHALTTEVGEALWEINNLDLRSRTGAAASLRDASGGRRIVYLSSGADSASRYNKLHTWLNQAGGGLAGRFPAGPLLAPVCGEETAWVETALRSLGQRFAGKHIAIAGRSLEARNFAMAGFETYLVGDSGEKPEGVHVIPSWKELSLPKLAK
jgi:hypothetical protein